MDQKKYVTYMQRGRFLSLHFQEKNHIFQISRGRIIANYADLQKIFKKDDRLLKALLNESIQPQNRTPHADGIIYGGVRYHYAFEFKLAKIGKTINVVTSNFNDNTNDFSGLCLENGFKVISIEKNRDDAFFEIVQSVVDGYLSVEELYKRDHPGKELVQLLKVNDKNFLKKLEECKKSKESIDLNRMLNEKMKPYLEGQSDVREIPQKEQIDIIYNYPTALLSIPRIRAKIPNVEWITFFTTDKGGYRFEQRVAYSTR
jgi:hypothetical protein